MIAAIQLYKMTDIRVDNLTAPVDVAEYLFRRLHEIGVRSVHGVPGDYNLVALDYLPKANLRWVGSVNELNAGPYSGIRPLIEANDLVLQRTPRTVMLASTLLAL